MLSCPACKRHIHASEARCPLCGARQGQTALSGRLLVGVMLLASTFGGGASGCGSDDVEVGTAGDTSTSMTTASTADEADEADADLDEEGANFHVHLGDDEEEEGETGSAQTCDVWLQDCPEGDKCVSVLVGEGEDAYANLCVPLTGDKAVGEACVHDGPELGTDDCDAWGACWVEDSEGNGVCRAFCAGSVGSTLCPQGTHCMVAHDQTVALCAEPCVPGGEPCPGEQACEWSWTDYAPGFACAMPPPAGDPADSPCAPSSNLTCGSGLACVDPPNPEQCAGNCCTEVCDVELPSCALEGAQCVAFEAPELANVGVCLIP